LEARVAVEAEQVASQDQPLPVSDETRRSMARNCRSSRRRWRSGIGVSAGW